MENEPIKEEIIEQEGVTETNEFVKKKTNNNIATAKWLIKRVLSVFFSLLYFTFLNVVVLLLIVKMSFSNGLFEQIIKISEDIGEKDYQTSEILAYQDSSTEIKNTYTINEKENSKVSQDKALSNVDFGNLNVDEIDMDGFSEQFEETFRNIMNENNIPEDVFAYLDETDENKKIVINIGTELIEYLYGVTNEFKINEKDVKKLLNNAIENYEKETGEKVDRSNVDKASLSFTKEFENYVEANANSEIRKIINSIFNGAIFYILIIITVICAVIIIVLNLKDCRFLKTLAFPTVITGLANLCIGKIILPQLDGLSKITALSDAMTLIGTVLTIASIAAYIIHYVIKYIKKKSSEAYA